MEHFIEYAGYSCTFSFTIFISAIFYLPLIPFLNIIINSLFSREVIWPKFLIEIIPALVFLVLMIPFFILSSDQKCSYLTRYLAEDLLGSYKHLLLIGILLLQTVIYSLIWYKKMHNYIQLVKSKSSSANIEFIPWISRLVGIIIMFTFFLVISWLARLFFPGNYHTLDQFGNIVLSFIPFVFLFLLFFLPKKPFPDATNNSYPEGNGKEVDLIHMGELTKLMEQEKIYLNSDLNLSGVADRMKLSRHDLSNILNQGFQKSFYDFVNEYRIAHARKLMDSDIIKTLSLSGIARESGFNSYVSFYRVFKRLNEQTPSDYLKNRKT